MKYIYLRTNLINGKQYVGQTNDFEGRECDWRCIKKNYSNKIISNDRIEFGLNNWTIEILKICKDEEGDYWECFYINKFNTKYPNGYNLTNGGGGIKGYKHSNEAKEKMSFSRKGRVGGFSKKTHTNETKSKMSKSHKGKYNTKKSKEVYQCSLDNKIIKVWPSTREAGRNGFSQVCIVNCCIGKQKKHKGYIWKYGFHKD